MRLSFGQELKQLQQQKLAPRMIQSMEILQLPMLALEERIEQEIQENPCLEKAESDPDLPDEEVEHENPDAPTAEEKELVLDGTKDSADDFERLMNLDEDWPDAFEDRPRMSSSRLAEEGDRKHDAMANMVSKSMIAGLLGGWGLFRQILILFAIPLAGGAAILFFM